MNLQLIDKLTAPLTFYQYTPNKKGYGVLYARIKVGEVLIRFSTNLKVKAEYWSAKEGRAVIPSNCSRLEREIHNYVNETLNSFAYAIESRCAYYLCDCETVVNDNIIAEELANIVNPNRKMAKKSVYHYQTLTQKLTEYAFKKKKGTSDISSKSVKKFEEFLKESKIKNEIKSANQDTFREFTNWLIEKKINGSSAKTYRTNIITLLHDIEKAEGVTFNVNGKALLKLEAPETDKKVRLTHEEISRLKKLELKGSEKIVRDLFVIQCQTSCRISDLKQLLNSANYEEEDGIITVVFKAKKLTKQKELVQNKESNQLERKKNYKAEDVTQNIPLNRKDFYGDTYDIMKPYIDNCPKITKWTAQYNDLLKKVAKKAKLNRTYRFRDWEDGKGLYEFDAPLYEQITSHWGRHSFITNCLTVFNMPENTVIQMSGHTDTDGAFKEYSHLDSQDRANRINASLDKLNRKEEEKQPNNNPPIERRYYEIATASEGNNYYIQGIREAKRVLEFMNIALDENADFDTMVEAIKDHQVVLYDLGMNIGQIKHLFTESGLSLKEKAEALEGLRKIYEKRNK